MKADKMFEKIGYKISENETGYYIDTIPTIAYAHELKCGRETISFYQNDKTIELYEDIEYHIITLTFEELKAIVKQCEEMGWDND